MTEYVGPKTDPGQLATQEDVGGGRLVGEIVAYGGATAPPGWFLCDGRSLSRSTYPELYAVLGIVYGASGQSTFNLPDLRGRTPVGEDGLAGRLNSNHDWRGASGGDESVGLVESHLPAHSHGHNLAAGADGWHGHGVSGSTDSRGSHSHGLNRDKVYRTGGGAWAANDGGSDVQTGGAGNHAHTLVGATAAGAGTHSHDIIGGITYTGNGSKHQNVQPYQIVNYLIKA